MALKTAAKEKAELKPAPPRPRCGRCTNDAFTYRIINQNHVPLCLDCDHQIVRDEAKERCQALGIHTVGDAKRWLRENFLRVKRMPVTQREPGCDDE